MNTFPPTHIVNVMLDLETLGTYPGCAILSIGAATFGKDLPIDLADRQFYVEISRKFSKMVGLEEELLTLDWWEKQDPMVKEQAFSGTTPLDTALIYFNRYIYDVELRSNTPVLLWSKGAAFDIPLLQVAYKKMGIKEPWRYQNTRCLRTLVSLATAAGITLDIPSGTPHHALVDAVNQAKDASKCLAGLEAIINHAH